MLTNPTVRHNNWLGIMVGSTITLVHRRSKNHTNIAMTSLSSAASFSPCLKPPNTLSSSHTNKGRTSLIFFSIKCESSTDSESGKRRSKLEIGSPIVVVEAPKMIKTAASVPCLRVNSGLVNPGDVGRIVSRKPKDVWAVRLGIGTYLIDGKYFKPLEVDE